MKAQPTIRNQYILFGDIVLMITAVLGSYMLRLELDSSFFLYLPSAYWMAGVTLLVKPLVYYFFSMYRRIWRYASMQELKLIVVAVTAASVLVSLAMVGLFTLGAFSAFPRSVLVIDWLLSLMLVGGLRLTVRLLAENKVLASIPHRTSPAKRVIIIGAGDAGAMVVRELQKNPQVGLIPIGFLDDNAAKQNQQIYGVPVVGTLSDLARVLDNRRVEEVVIAIPSAPGRVVRLVADVCRLRNMPFRTMPGMYELLGGKVSVSRLREVQIVDLLRRESNLKDDERVGEILGGRTVLVTGAGGSIGRELCRQIARWGPSSLILLGHGENSIYEAMLELRESFPSVVMRPVICDVRDLLRLENIFDKHQPDIVFHAAAHKHVPMMEMNAEEAVTNNILGTRNVVEASLMNKVDKLVMISTDKAIRPVNIMGATKRMAEMIVLNEGRRAGQSFSVVRFGNVLGSRGSVVPLFKRQIARGGPVTVTHPDMQRYFMTIPEAVHLVLQAAAIGTGGETFVLNMGEQVRILDLAEDLIRLSGLEPGRDIEIVFSGIRPGEKLSEDLWDEEHTFEPTTHPEIYRLVSQEELAEKELERVVYELIALANEGEATNIVKLLDDAIPDSDVLRTPPYDLTEIE